MTTAEPPSVQSSAVRDADLVVARLHLRLGSLSLARAELEALAGRDALDEEGIVDLAEVRWRTGDLAGAGEAAVARLEHAPDDVIALVIAAEVQADLGRPSEARRLANRALTRSDVPIDVIFAGMPRSSVWPIDPGAPPEPAGELFDDLPQAPGGHLFAPAPVFDETAESTDGSAFPAAGEAAGPSLWEAHSETIAPVLPDSKELLKRSRAALRAGRPGQAAAGLALALRADSSLAPRILDLLAGRTEPVLALVRGDANRIVGHEAEALRDYATAVAAIDLQRRSDDRPAEPDESKPPRGSRRRQAATTDTDAASAAADSDAAAAEAERHAAELTAAERDAAALAADQADGAAPDTGRPSPDLDPDPEYPTPKETS
jgi:hypothetical protein